MRIIVVIIIFMFLTPFIYGQETIYIDETGDTINKRVYLEKWRNKDSLLSAWHLKDKKANAMQR